MTQEPLPERALGAHEARAARDHAIAKFFDSLTDIAGKVGPLLDELRQVEEEERARGAHQDSIRPPRRPLR